MVGNNYMVTQPASEERARRVILHGQAMVRLIESIDMLLTNSGNWRESLLLKAPFNLVIEEMDKPPTDSTWLEFSLLQPRWCRMTHWVWPVL